MSARDDVIEIPIEIRTEDAKEIRDLLAQIDEAESKIRTLRPRRGKAGDAEARSPIRTGAFEEQGGIFGGREGEAVPLKTRDRTSRQALQRENEFSKLRNQVGDLQEQQQSSLSALDVLFGGALLTGGVGGKAAKIAGGGFLNMAKSFISKIIPILIPAMIAFGLMQTIIGELIRPGGEFDRRYKRVIEKSQIKSTEKEEQAQLARGVRTLIVTSTPALRGPTTQIFNSQQAIKSGIQIFDAEAELIGKLP